MMYAKINLNDAVLVKLNEDGYKHLTDRHNSFVGIIQNWETRDPSYYKDKSDDKGYTKFQFWDLMNLFGDKMTLGSKPMFDELDIIIRKKDLKDIEL